MKNFLKGFYLSIVKIFGNHGFGRISPISYLNKSLLRLIKSDFAIINGFRMYLGKKDPMGLSVFGVHEKGETEVVKRIIKKGDIVIDCGSNVGYYTLLFSKLVGENGQVFAFEPDSTNFSLLKKNLKENNVKNVIALNLAVSDKSEQGFLFLDKESPGHHRMYSEKGKDKGKKKVQCIKLDNYFKNYKRKINFIKLDIEGSEGRAIKGAENILKNSKGLKIIMEFCPSTLHECGTDIKELLETIKRHGFSIKEIELKTSEIKEISESVLLNPERFKINKATNLLLERNSP